VKVTLIASTDFHTLPDVPWDVEERFLEGDHLGTADDLAEFAGRACYQSWTRPNPKTATNAGYLAHILEVGHESVLEHASATFYVEGVSRALTHELIRHRHLSYSQLSQRYVDESDFNVVLPPATVESGGIGSARVNYIAEEVKRAYPMLVQQFEQNGLTRKQAREAARAVLPNATETKIVVTGNHRAWRDMLKKRWSLHADAEIRAFAGEVLKQLREIAPNTYQDIPEVPYGTN
jgi:thymidylate synthase (FAD)